MNSNGFVVIFITVPNEEEGLRIGKYLVENRLAACTNIVPGLRSIYRWKGEVCDDKELLCMVKTRRSLFDQVVDAVKKLHSYEVAEIIALPIVEGVEDYIEWLSNESG